MTDREKVIKGLECLAQAKEPTANPCNGCEYINRPNFAFCVKDVAIDALALLKEQEAVKPTFKQDEKGIFVWCCGSCGAYMYHIYDGIDKAKEYAKFCRQCGKPVLWEGR